MKTNYSDERGVALIVAIFALVVVGALVTGSFFLGIQEQQVGRNMLQMEQAISAADGGAQFVVADWDASFYNETDVGDSVTFEGWLPSNTGWYRGSAFRVSEQVFLVRSEGFSADSTARQQVGMLVRLKPFDIVFTAALKVQGATRIGGNSFIDGNDSQPSGWADCDSTVAPLAGLTVDDSSLVDIQCPNESDCLGGSPLVQVDTTISDSSMTTFGELNFDDLASLANKTLGTGPYNGIGPVVDGSGECATSLILNWGDPLDPTAACGNYFPILHAPSGTKLTGGAGQGILLVDGDLEVQGGFEFYGLVIITGILKTAGTGGHFNGGVIAANVNLDQNTVLGNALVSYSSCAVQQSLNSTAPVAQMRERGWLNLN